MAEIKKTTEAKSAVKPVAAKPAAKPAAKAVAKAAVAAKPAAKPVVAKVSAAKPVVAKVAEKKVSNYPQIKVTLVKSAINEVIKNKRTIEALGLKKVGQSKVHNDIPAIQGMIFRVKHLVKVDKA